VSGGSAVGASGWGAGTNGGWTINKGEFMFRCRTDASGDTVSDRESHDEHTDSDTLPPDRRKCQSAYAHFDEIAAMRRSAAPNRGVRARPSSIQFFATCRELPEEVQGCLVPAYYNGHADDCEANFAHLRKAQLAKIDALFFDDDAEPAPPVVPAKAPLHSNEF